MNLSVQLSGSNDVEISQRMSEILKPLDDVLKCHICFDYFNICVTTKCAHSYCSLCIRKYMTYKSQCPECFQEAVEPDLRNNRQIDQVLHAYNKIRNFLKLSDEKKNHLEELSDSTDDVSALNMPHSEVILKTEKHKKTETVTPTAGSSTEDEVSCPSCSKPISIKDINDHLDICLSVGVEGIKKWFHKTRRPLSKVVYHLLTDKGIKKILKENGLSTVGDRQSLINRHKNFIVLYNAECDSLHPRPVSEIVKQVEKEECETERGSSRRLFQTSKMSDAEKIAEENENYMKQNRNQFNVLVSQIMSRTPGNNLQDEAASTNIQETMSEVEENEKLILESEQQSSGKCETAENSPVLFVTSESEDESCNSTIFDNSNVRNSTKHKAHTSSCHSSSGSSDNYTICQSMKEVKRLRRKI